MDKTVELYKNANTIHLFRFVSFSHETHESGSESIILQFVIRMNDYSIN